MATNAVLVKIDGARVAQAVEEAREQLDGAQGEVVLDFSSVRRIDSGALRAMEHLAEAVGKSGTKLVLNNVNIDIYKVFKLMKLVPRFSFRT
jgi:anti-anti-sigma regulatory factor